MKLRNLRPGRCIVAVLCLPLALACSAAPGPVTPFADLPRSAEGRAYDQPREATEHYLRKRLPAGESELPVERYFAALDQMRHMPQYSIAERSELPSRAELEASGRSYVMDAARLGGWEFVGPQNVGGRVRALVIHPTQPNTMWAAAVGGGVWKTTNGGLAWAPISDFLPNIAVASLALDPKNPNVLYAGTGEGFGNVDAIRGAGIFKSVNGGQTWARLSATANSNFHYVNDIVISPTNSQRLYAATATGIWRSLNGGTAWTRVLNPGAASGCPDLAISPKGPDDLVLASCGMGADQGAIWRHAKAQATGAWTRVLTEAPMGRTSLAFAPSNPAIVYALASSRVSEIHGAVHAVFRSAAGGAAGSWVAQARNTGPNLLGRLLLTNPLIALCEDEPAFFHQGWYDNVVAVDPRNPNRVWAGGIDLFRSDDGGKTWGAASSWWSTATWAPIKAPKAYVHADQHVIAFHPQYNGTTNRTLFVGNDGGVFMTANAMAKVGKTPAAVCNPNQIKVVWQRRNALGNTQFYHGEPFPDGSEFFGGTQDNGTNYGWEGLVAGWREILGGDGGYVAYGSTHVFASQPQGAISRSTDGVDWEPITGALREQDGFLFIAPLAVDPTQRQRLVLGGTRLWLTQDSGATWQAISGQLSEQGISAAAIRGGQIVAGTADGGLVTPSGGVRPRQGYVSSVAIDPHDPSRLYATYSTFGGAHVWRSTNGGVSWQPVDGSGAARIPDVPVHSIVVDPLNPLWLYVGTDVGVFLSTNGGATWAIENTGFPNVVVEHLAISEQPPQYLFAFTHGRSAWRVALPE